MPPSSNRLWTRQQLLVAFWLYCTESFGRLHKSNPKIMAAAGQIGRTPSALAMKACNFASLDPKMMASGRAGLSNASHADRELWSAFTAEPDALALEACAQWELVERSPSSERGSWSPPTGPSEIIREVAVRRVQRFFRDAVLVAYDGRCAVTGLAVPELLVASHISPWAADEHRRADPTNGILLNALLDRAFDRYLITFDERLRVVCSRQLHRTPERARQILEVEGAELRLPERFAPDPAMLAQHRLRLAA